MPGPTGSTMPGGALAHELVEVRGVRLLELGAVIGVGVPAQPVHHDEEDLGVGGLDQRREVHGPTLVCVDRTLRCRSVRPRAARAVCRKPVMRGANALAGIGGLHR